MKRDVSSFVLGLPAAAKAKKRRLLVWKNSKAIRVIACLVHYFQNVVFVFSIVELLDYCAYFFAIVLHYGFYTFTFHSGADLDDKVQLLS
jgi:hypothetical protein